MRAQRRQAQGLIGALPISSGEFAERDYAGAKQWNNVSQELSRRGVEIDYLNATINGLRRMLKEDAQRGVARSPADVARFTAELDENERLLKQRQGEVVDLRRQIEIGRAQIGIGDARYQNDAVARVQFRDALEREVQLASQGQAGGGAQRYAGKVRPALEQSRAVEDKLVAQFAELERQVALRITEVQNKVEAERLKINGFNMTLGAYDTEAHDLVGQVAKRDHPARRRRHHRAGVGSPRRGARSRAQPPDGACPRGAAPRRGAARGARRHRRADEGLR